MKRLILVAGLLPSLALAGVTRQRADHEALILSVRFGVAAAAQTNGGVVLPARVFSLDRVTTHVGSASGGGAGVTRFRATDGTNTCDCEMGCVASQSTGAKAVTCSGTCVFPPAAAVVFSINASTCTSTQPTIYNIDYRGTWR
jgi:hypothetical protein